MGGAVTVATTDGTGIRRCVSHLIGTDYCKHSSRADLIAALPTRITPPMKATTTTAAAATIEPSNGGKRKETEDDTMNSPRLGKVTKRKKRVTLNTTEKNNTSVMIMNDQTGEMPDAVTSQPQASSTPDKTRSTTTTTSESHAPPTNDQTFADELTPMPDLDETVPFTTDDFLLDDDLNHESTSSEEHVRDLELNAILPEMVDVPPTATAPEAGQDQKEGLLDKRMDFSNVAQRELLEERAAEHGTGGRKENGDAFPSVLYKTQN